MADVKGIDVVKHTVDPFDRGEVLKETNMWAGEMSGWGDVQGVRRCCAIPPWRHESRSEILLHLLC